MKIKYMLFFCLIASPFLQNCAQPDSGSVVSAQSLSEELVFKIDDVTEAEAIAASDDISRKYPGYWCNLPAPFDPADDSGSNGDSEGPSDVILIKCAEGYSCNANENLSSASGPRDTYLIKCAVLVVD